MQAACGVLAPASFVTAWAVCGSLREGYDPVQQAISQLAREGTAGRLGMTAGFVGFGVLLPVFAQRLPVLVAAGPGLRVVATTAGLSTLAVAAFPLQQVEGGTGDALHAAGAGVGYLAMAASPLLAARPLWASGRRTAGAASAVVGAVSGGALLASLTVGPTGLWQRVGLGVVDAWFASVATWALRSERG
ncbi:MAG: hypothetical protein QOJ79_2528 [Actinomycetota bacterium]|jgi:hypothetical protein|nr:hypothetical protein [Actinomycetota bacterium]